MSKITDFLDTASQAYYNGNPIISDEQFDSLADSVAYNKVGSRTTGKEEKHYFPLYSLDKYYLDDKGPRPLKEVKEVGCSIKLDGAAISVLYIDGQLTRVLTRGDGITGQVITDKFLGSSIVPQQIAHGGIVQTSGEIAAPSHVPNARNYAAGALNLKDKEEFKTRAIEFFAYGVYPYFTDSYTEDMKILKRLGFNTVKEENLEKIYPTDGFVFRVDSNKLFDSMGYTSKFPRGAFAQKERKAHVETKIIGVEWAVGRTGRVTPVALLEPVYIDNALVSRATLNNPGFIESLGIEIGDTVAVIKAGEIIPCILHKVDA